MKRSKMFEICYNRFLPSILAVFIAIFQVAPSLASAQQISTQERAETTETTNASVAGDHSDLDKDQLGHEELHQGEPYMKSVTDPEREQGAGSEQIDGEIVEAESRGMSTWTKVGIGVGIAVVAGVALAAGGGSDDPSYPTQEGMVGVWNAQGTRTDGSDSYTGTYTLYNGGVHSYDLFVGSLGERIRGNGNWYQPPETYSLSLKNDTGSLYQGEFASDNFTTITMITSDGRWKLTLSKM